MTVVDDAIRLCARFPVFPVRGDKKPACKHGFKDAVTTPAEVVDLWRLSPGPLIGVPTGEASGIDVLDIDPRHGGNAWLEEARDSLPITRTHHTQSGGLHILFRHAEGVRNSASKIAPGVDTRGAGGYIVFWPAAGCRVENPTTLEDWPKWLLKLLNPPIKKRHIPAPATKAEASTRALIMIENAYDRVRNARPGQRHYQLRAAAATLGGLADQIGQSLDKIEDDLVALIMQTGAEDRVNAEKTARWALEKGRASPLLTR
jgi:hypothetical protein